ncbi:hypothetical protein D3C79_803230 [compost metagenome]
MNTTRIVDKGIKSGKLKMGTCAISWCNNHELLYKVGNDYICTPCLDAVGKALAAKEAKHDTEK